MISGLPAKVVLGGATCAQFLINLWSSTFKLAVRPARMTNSQGPAFPCGGDGLQGRSSQSLNMITRSFGKSSHSAGIFSTGLDLEREEDTMVKYIYHIGKLLIFMP